MKQRKQLLKFKRWYAALLLCIFSVGMTWASTTDDLVEMQVGDVFVPSVSVDPASLAFDNKILGMEAQCDYKSGYGLRIKNNRYLAFKVPANAVIRVKVGNHHASETRTIQLGTQTGGHSVDLSSLPVTAGTTGTLTYKYETGGVVYLSASADMYLKELAIVNLYKITFKHNGHGTYDDYVLSDQSALPNPISKPAAGDGYTFVDWYNEPELLTPASPGADLTADKTLYAKWMINKGFTIPFNGNGINVTVDHLVEPQRGMGVTLPTAYENSENITLPSKWDFQDGITGKGTYGPFQEAYKEGSIAAGNVLTQTVTGLANGRYEVVLDVAASSTNIRGNHDYPTENNLTQAFAGSATQFIPVLDRTALDTETDYDRVVLVAEVTDGTLTYGIKNAQASGNWYVCRVQSIKKIDDSNFTGWNTKADGTGTGYTAGANLSPNYNGTVLYAQWNKTYNFRPVAKTGGTITSVTVDGQSVSFSNNHDIKVDENAKVVMTVSLESGYKFKNWSNNGTVGEESNNSLTYTISQIKANTTLTANFVALSDATDPNPANGTLSGTTVTINPFPASYANNTQTIDLNLPAGATFTVTSGNANVIDGKLSVVAPLANNSADVTIEVTAENGTTKKTYTVHVSTVEGASFSYTVNAVDGSTILKAIASGDYAQGTGNITVYYPQHVLVDNKLYELSKGTNDNGWYRKIFAPDANDYIVNIEKTAIVNNVVYFTEAEDLPGFSASTGGSANVRSSMGLVARSNGKFANACTLNKGTYRIVARSLSSHDRTAIFNVGNETYTFNYSSSVSGFDQRIVVTENNTDVSVAVNGDSSDGLDWFYIQDLGVLPVTEDGQEEYLTKANYEAHSYFTSKGSWDTSEKTEDGVTGIYMSFNQNDANIQLKTNGAFAFEVFADANSDNKKFDVTVDLGSAVTYTIKKGLQTSGIIATGSNTADVDIKISRNNKTSLWPVKVKFYTKPLIVGAESTVTMGKGEQSTDLNVVGGIAVLVTPSAQASALISNVRIEDGKLYATPVKAGVAHLSIDIVDGESNVLNTVDYVVNVVKQKVTLTYLANEKNSYSATDGAFTSPTAVVKTVDGGADVTSQVTTLYISDDESLVRYSGTEAKLVPNMQGVAKLKAVLYNDPVYEADDAIAIFTVNVTDGIQMHLSSSIPAINSTLVAKNGDNVLMTMTYGGYKYGEYTHSDSDKGTVTDSWKGDKGTDSNTSAYGGQGKDIFGNTFDNEIDGFGLQAQAQYDSRDEYNRGILWFSTSDVKTDGSTNYTKNERIKPFSLPVKGAYLKFEAEVNGTLTAYVLQNGNINFDSGDNRDKPVKEDLANKKRAIGTSPRVYYWFNQDGYRIDPISYTSKQPLTIGRDYNNDIKNELDGWYGSNAGLKDMLEGGGWPTQAEVNANLQKPVPTPQPVVRYNDGYMVAQKAYVKYVIPVVAGDTYYFFSNASKVGAAGFNFQPAEDGTVDLILPEDGGANTMEAHTNNDSKALNCATDDATTHKTTNSIEMYKEVTLPRRFKVNTWSTICLPFHVTEAQVEKVFGKGTNLIIYNGVLGNRARFQKHVNQDILAGQPYLIYPTGTGVEGATDGYIGGTDSNIDGVTFTNVNFTPNIASQSYASDNDGAEEDDKSKPNAGYGKDAPSYNFIGTLVPTKVKPYDYYVNNITGQVTRYTGSNDITLNAYYAYLKRVAGANAKVISSISIDNVEGDSIEDPTAIMNALVDMGVEVRPADGIYNLSGQKVAESTKNLSKGIYIINGQKVIIK